MLTKHKMCVQHHYSNICGPHLWCYFLRSGYIKATAVLSTVMQVWGFCIYWILFIFARHSFPLFLIYQMIYKETKLQAFNSIQREILQKNCTNITMYQTKLTELYLNFKLNYTSITPKAQKLKQCTLINLLKHSLQIRITIDFFPLQIQINWYLHQLPNSAFHL